MRRELLKNHLVHPHPFAIDGLRRNLDYGMDEFLFTHKPEPHSLITMIRKNFIIFFRTLGKDFSSASLLLPNELPLASPEAFIMGVPAGQCHGVAQIFMEGAYNHNPKTPFQLHWGFVDLYENAIYKKTFCHSFIVLAIEKPRIVDPIVTKHTLMGLPKYHTNHFGVHIPYPVLQELVGLAGATSVNYNFSGYIFDHIFQSDEATQGLIQHIQHAT